MKATGKNKYLKHSTKLCLILSQGISIVKGYAMIIIFITLCLQVPYLALLEMFERSQKVFYRSLLLSEIRWFRKSRLDKVSVGDKVDFRGKRVHVFTLSIQTIMIFWFSLTWNQKNPKKFLCSSSTLYLRPAQISRA